MLRQIGKVVVELVYAFLVRELCFLCRLFSHLEKKFTRLTRVVVYEWMGPNVMREHLPDSPSFSLFLRTSALLRSLPDPTSLLVHDETRLRPPPEVVLSLPTFAFLWTGAPLPL